MVFTTHIFIFYFLPAALLLYYLLPRGRNVFLLIASYVFYGWWNPWFVLLMFGATLLNYLCGKVIAQNTDRGRDAKRALTVAVVGSLSLLGFFKYAVFTQENLNALLELFGADTFPVFVVILPVGISFFIFQSVSYPIDVYRRESPPVRNLMDFACFVALFPQLIAGPIVRYNTIADQLVTRRHTLDRFTSGVAIFILGFAKKLLLADSLGLAADAAFAAESPLPLDAWFGVIAYAFQIYFDFAGYSDMAIGLGRMFGFEFPRNFDAPYRSASITEFWRRWHISLSTFLRDYLYIPLGGNRLGAGRTYVNLAIVMLLGGLWHGANWTFVAWGAIHGGMLAFERWRGKESLYARLPRVLGIAITFVLVLISWVFFRSPDIATAFDYLRAMAGMNAPAAAAPLLGALLYTPRHLAEMALAAVLVWQATQAFDWVQRLNVLKCIALVVLFVVSLFMMFTQDFSPFLYFQF